MCRLAFFPPGTDPEEARGLGLLEHLVTMQGRDGMGVATWTPKGFRIAKGCETNPKEAIEKLKGYEKGLLFHCRTATSGGKSDLLCQPFGFGEYLTVHNGHWSDWKEAFWGLVGSGAIKPEMGPFNDSATAAAMVGIAGRRALNWIDSGVFITWKKNEKWPVVAVRRGDFAYSSLPGGGIVYASSFPMSWPVEQREFGNDSSAVLTPAGPCMVFGVEPYKRGRVVGSAREMWRGGGDYAHGYVGT